MVRQWQELFYDKRYACTCMDHAPDFVKLADAFGAPWDCGPLARTKWNRFFAGGLKRPAR